MSKRVAIDDPIEKRAAMVNGMFDLPGETLAAMGEVCQASEVYAKELQTIFKKNGLKVDTGRAIAAMDGIQATKNIACDALILPHASKMYTFGEINQ